MTPELAQSIMDKPYNEELQSIMHDVYERFSVEDITMSIARIRAEKTLASLASEVSK